MVLEDIYTFENRIFYQGEIKYVDDVGFVKIDY